MQAVLRTYSGHGAHELFDVLEQRKTDVETALRAVKGFVSYTLVRTGDGGFSFTICRDQAGIDESVKVARDWISHNAAKTNTAAPAVAHGNVIVHA